MTIYSNTIGEGEDIVLLHGWGMNSEIWFEVANELQKDYRVSIFDLPGHGYSADVQCEYTETALLKEFHDILPMKSTLIGWSLGGLIAQLFALKFPDRVKKLILVASNAQFQKNEHWPTGMKQEVMNGFVENLKENYQATLQQFLMLQALGAENSKQTIRELKQRLFVHGEPETHTLEKGLLFLKNESTVNELENISCPTLLINGRLDGLVPVAAGRKMAERIPNCELLVIDKAAHAPFVSHFELFVQYIKEFMKK